ncbi:uncharacterized protein [Dermacentor andersoni]|uniref:uncharacterized protein n=1 Tax=Dermacentor andersoni TaxID=34620 RepID=UPI0024178EF1|nr:uncharacterized protein LOC129387898 [Dermacentor andersoni]
MPLSVLWDRHYLATLGWDYIEALMTRAPEVQPRIYLSQHGLLNVEEMPPDVFRRNFRFDKSDFSFLQRALKILEVVTSAQGVHVRGLEALCICLKRLTYPNRLCDLHHFCGPHGSVISSISNKVFDHTETTFGHLLDDLTKHEGLSLNYLDELSQAVYNEGADLPNCWAFIDGTARSICRPSEHQRQYFSGHKRLYVLKYQAVMWANRLVEELDGPCSGKRHDAGILHESGLYGKLENLVQGKDYVIYGDPAYPLGPLLMKPHGGAHLTQAHQQFNTSMRSVRQPVEGGLGKVVSQFDFLDFEKKTQELLL